MSSNNDINVSGTITALLHNGFTLIAALCELVDNSIGAGAMNIVLNLDTRTTTVSISDDGNGMNLGELKKAGKLYERSKSSNTRQGCFGIGLQAACAVITNLENSTCIISKTASTDLVELKQDWPTIVENNDYNNQVRTGDDLSRNGENTWREHRVNEEQGTIITLNASEENMAKLIELVKSTDSDSLLYFFGWTYRKSINRGVKITIKIDGVIYKEVIAIDPLEYDNVAVKNTNKQEVKLDVFVDPTAKSTRLYFTNQAGQYGYVDGKKRSSKFQVEDPHPSFERNSVMTYRSVYNLPEEWNDLQQYVFDHIGFKPPSQKDGKKRRKDQTLYNGMGGRYNTRGDKPIHRSPIDRSKRSGHHSQYKYHDDSRHEFSFTYLNDSLVSLLINKSKLDEGTMDTCVVDSLNYLDKQFEKKMGDLYKVAAAAPEPEVVLPPPPVGVGPNIDAASPIIQQSNAVVDGVGPNIDEAPITYEIAQDLNNIESNSEGTDSDTASESDREVSPPAPIVTNVSASTQIRYLAGDSLRLLEQMKVSNRHLSEFETLLETVIRNYMSGTSDDESTVWLRFMTPDQKYNMTIELIGQKYSGMYMWYPMLCGSDVYNCYTQLFTNN